MMMKINTFKIGDHDDDDNDDDDDDDNDDDIDDDDDDNVGEWVVLTVPLSQQLQFLMQAAGARWRCSYSWISMMMMMMVVMMMIIMGNGECQKSFKTDQEKCDDNSFVVSLSHSDSLLFTARDDITFAMLVKTLVSTI